MLNGWAFWISVFAVVLQAVVAFVEGNFSRGQQIARGITNGFPFTRHLGMWSDLFLLPCVISLMWRYQPEWDGRAILIALLVSAVATGGMHYSWIKGTDRLEHILSPAGMTASGCLHMIYMTCVFAIILLFYFACEPTPSDKQLIAALLFTHVGIGTMGVSIMKIGVPDVGSIATTAVVGMLLAYSVFK